jgi:hypothetical protein
MAKNHFSDFSDFFVAFFGHPATASAALSRRLVRSGPGAGGSPAKAEAFPNITATDCNAMRRSLIFGVGIKRKAAKGIRRRQG